MITVSDIRNVISNLKLASHRFVEIDTMDDLK